MIVFLSPGGIDNIEIDMEKQRVYVTSVQLSADELLETIKKAGKACSYIGTAWEVLWAHHRICNSLQGSENYQINAQIAVLLDFWRNATYINIIKCILFDVGLVVILCNV